MKAESELIVNSNLLNFLAVNKLLLEGANVNAVNDKGYNALHRAIDNIYLNKRGTCDLTLVENIVGLLILAGINLDAQTTDLKLTALHFAARFGNLSTMKLLIDAGADLFIRNYANRTPLETATKAGKIEAQKLLQGATLIMSSHKLDSRSVEEMLVGGADVNAVDNKGYNALHRAIENIYLNKQGTCDITLVENIIKLLVSAGVDLNAQTKELKLTALHFAAKFSNLSAIKLLVDAEANLFIKNYANRTPLETAVKARKFEAIELLKELENNVDSIDMIEEGCNNLAGDIYTISEA